MRYMVIDIGRVIKLYLNDAESTEQPFAALRWAEHLLNISHAPADNNL